MKKILIALSLFSTLSLANNYAVKGGVEYSYQKEGGEKTHLVGGGVDFSYVASVYKFSDDLEVQAIPSIELKLYAKKLPSNATIQTENKVKTAVEIQIYESLNLSPMISYKLNDDLTLKGGIKLGFGFSQQILNVDKIEFGTVSKRKLSNHIVIPYSLVLGLDYKNITSTLDFGGKSYKQIKGENNYNSLSIGINIGSKF